MDKEQTLALAKTCGVMPRLTPVGTDEVWANKSNIEAFYHAAIESYKAELLKEAGEPVLYAEFAEDGGWLGDASEYAGHLEEPHALFTSDQVAAAILKAEQRVAEWQPISTAPKDGAWIVVTSTHNKYYRASVQFYDDHWYDTQEVIHDDLMENAATHWMPLPKAPANGAS